jgi:ankyrin repeat protein
MLVSYSPLGIAAREGYAAIVDALLAAGADVDAGITAGPFGVLASWTPLYAAAANGHADVVRALLKANATVDMGWGGFIGTTWLGAPSGSPLAVAEQKNHTAVAALLRAHMRGSCDAADADACKAE